MGVYNTQTVGSSTVGDPPYVEIDSTVQNTQTLLYQSIFNKRRGKRETQTVDGDVTLIPVLFLGNRKGSRYSVSRETHLATLKRRERTISKVLNLETSDSKFGHGYDNTTMRKREERRHDD